MAMIAAAFDIHDDIMDNSKRKHDHMTVFGKFGSEISILLGDAFLIKGLTLLGPPHQNMLVTRKRKSSQP